MKRFALCIAATFAALNPPAIVLAESLPQALSRRAVSAVVKVGVVDDAGRPMGFGSGTLIDPRGYVLTNFHVVGDKKAGDLRNTKNVVLLGMVSSSRQAVQFDWEGKVVRADPRLDLALVRITRSRNGRLRA